MARKTQVEWTKIIEDAARSPLTAAAYCEQIGITANQFYKMSRKLGFTKDGERTEKWYAAARKEIQPGKTSGGLVPVPVRTIQSAEAVPDRQTAAQPQIVIQYEGFRIAVGDDFSKDALQRVVEVVVNA